MSAAVTHEPVQTISISIGPAVGRNEARMRVREADSMAGDRAVQHVAGVRAEDPARGEALAPRLPRPLPDATVLDVTHTIEVAA
ncbi:MAG TPA: hypothetical protein VNJ04_04995 [Gemmatimonadaceae bacterium]|nr:hypothetical protein [Gemmatimonadaceae bacterium]